MPKYPYRDLGTSLNRDYRNNLNANFDDVETDIRDIQGQFDGVVETVSEEAFDKVVDSARIEWLPPVDTFADLGTAYPTATEGKTAMARDSGKVYRFDGVDWIEIQDIDPTAINEVDSRLSAQIGDLPNTDAGGNSVWDEFEQRGVNVKWYGASGSDQTTTGSIDSGSNSLSVASVIDFEVGQGIAIDHAGPGSVKEVASLQITAGATVDGNVTVTLDGIGTDVAVLNGDSAITIADKIRNTPFTGWTTGGTAGTDTVTFTADTYGNKQDATYSDGGTGATGTMSTTTQGVNDRLFTFINAIDAVTNTITLVDTAGTTVSDVTVSHDDTTTIQDAIDQVYANGGGTIFIPPGIYMINPNLNPDTGTFGGIKLKSNTVVIISPSAKFKAITTATGQYAIIRMYEAENISIFGGHIEGEQDTHTGTTGEWGFGIDIRACTNIMLTNVKSSNCWGDGFYISEYNGVKSKDITFVKCHSDGNRRQGLSVVGCDYFTDIAGVYENTLGTAPEAGVDFEPNGTTRNTGCKLIGTTVRGNKVGVLYIRTDDLILQGVNYENNTLRSLQISDGSAIENGSIYKGSPSQGHLHFEDDTELQELSSQNSTFVVGEGSNWISCPTGATPTGIKKINNNKVIFEGAVLTSSLRSDGLGLNEVKNNTFILDDTFSDVSLTSDSVAIVFNDGWDVGGNTIINHSALSPRFFSTGAGIKVHYGDKNLVKGTPITKVGTIDGEFSKSINPAPLNTGTVYTTDIPASGAKIGDRVEVYFDTDLLNLVATAYVQSLDMVRVVVANLTGADVDLPACNVYAKVYNN